jgi:excisionase family DNA binding protein
MTQRVYTIHEVAALLRVSRDTVYRLAARDELPGRKIGRVWRFPEEAIQEYLRGGKSHEVEARAHDQD